ncbi:MAG: hypothetical protein CM1200mP18_02310 [Gammaproteobacteria bacterium]|nr:MAG: hypothetical protein CM1200mP18_02310 [Gammaproteobacteria bacterium]
MPRASMMWRRPATRCERGFLDLVGMTRAHLADPHIVAKIIRGEEDQVRPCVGAGYCIDRIYGEGEALCLHNPATGREASMPHVIGPNTEARRRVVVVGAGARRIGGHQSVCQSRARSDSDGSCGSARRTD